MSKKVVKESTVKQNSLSGFGENVIKLTDKDTEQTIAYVGIQQGEEKIHFAQPITVAQLEAVYELIQSKKFNKHLNNEDFKKAQKFADRKFA